ncbi:Homeodomain-only protein [Tupaia chinensis]|uniref:Homeodomain-only protein n=1 Tax=Tupaia chinensis TaxID=246437 RepID=L9KP70_TUPCH|nr:Homeodomain-only protein [Tupaia chinensis]
MIQYQGKHQYFVSIYYDVKIYSQALELQGWDRMGRQGHSRAREVILRRSQTSHRDRVGQDQELETLEYNFYKVNKHPDPTMLCLIMATAGFSKEEIQKWLMQHQAGGGLRIACLQSPHLLQTEETVGDGSGAMKTFCWLSPDLQLRGFAVRRRLFHC